MNKERKDIPTIITALEHNEIVWNWLISTNLDRNSEDVERFIGKMLDKCSKDRIELVVELEYWLSNSIKLYKRENRSVK